MITLDTIISGSILILVGIIGFLIKNYMDGQKQSLEKLTNISIDLKEKVGVHSIIIERHEEFIRELKDVLKELAQTDIRLKKIEIDVKDMEEVLNKINITLQSKKCLIDN